MSWYQMESCIRGFHIYKEVWTPFIGEKLGCACERSNREDPFAVAIKRGPETVGHVPRTISCVCTLFLRQRGSISCEVTGSRRSSVDLPQGGLELPCILTFSGPKELVDKVKMRIGEIAQRKAGDSSAAVSTKGEETVPTEGEHEAVPTEGEDTAVPTEGEDTAVPTYGEDEAVPIKDEEDGVCTMGEETEELSEEVTANKKEQVWLSFKDIVLRLNDKHTIDCDLQLTDLHINFAQRLLKQQFPKKNGLRSTLLQERPHSQPTENAMQILHVKGDHWIVAHTKPRGKLVYVYDSSYSSVDQKTASMLMINFRCSMLSIRSMRCQKQEGISDCGLFAIAFATLIAHGEDPGSREYCQGRMRSHLTQCFLDKKLVLFP